MSAHAKKRKVDTECRIFNKHWTAKYLFAEVGANAVCFVCGEQVAVFKEYNVSRHYQTKHAEKYKNLNDAEMARTSKTLLAALQKQQDVKECLVDSAALICPEKKGAFEQVPLSRRTVTRRVEDIAGNLELQLQHEVARFDCFSLALDESCDVRDTAQLLVFVRGITGFKITEELAAVRPMKGTTTGADLFTEVNACMDTLGLKWERLAGVTTDGCPNLTRKKFRTFETYSR
ncbi:unnamed protein product [Knipowitschia caucasica]